LAGGSPSAPQLPTERSATAAPKLPRKSWPEVWPRSTRHSWPLRRCSANHPTARDSVNRTGESLPTAGRARRCWTSAAPPKRAWKPPGYLRGSRGSWSTATRRHGSRTASTSTRGRFSFSPRPTDEGVNGIAFLGLGGSSSASRYARSRPVRAARGRQRSRADCPRRYHGGPPDRGRGTPQDR
jgi:hypothetical protein